MIQNALNFVRTGLTIPTLKRIARIKERFPKVPSLGAPVTLKFAGMPEHRCFGCSPKNPIGLQLALHEAKGWDLACAWDPRQDTENYPGMVHGGLVFSVLDELLGDAIFHRGGYLPISLGGSVNWYKPAKSGQRFIGGARIVSRYKTFLSAEAFLFRSDGKVVARLSGRYFTPPLSLFRRLAEVEFLPDITKSWFAPENG
jgi:acyl-coenzyme A thioesterase PaaI-like protein